MVNILGTEYKLTLGCDDKTADGWAKFYKKEIQVRPKEQMLDGVESDDEEKTARQKEVNCIIVFSMRGRARITHGMKTL